MPNCRPGGKVFRDRTCHRRERTALKIINIIPLLLSGFILFGGGCGSGFGESVGWAKSMQSFTRKLQCRVRNRRQVQKLYLEKEDVVD